MPRDLHPLTYLSEFFDTVEINSSFYRPPAPRNCASWVEKVTGNPRFKFAVKLWQRFSHERESEPTTDDVRAFCEGIEPLVSSGVLGAILVQFPWSFKRTRENRVWLANVIDMLSGYPLAVEVRHDSWDLPEVYEAFAERGVAFCNIDHPIFSGSLKPAARVTARLAYVRLHGRNRHDWFRKDATRDERYDYLYSEDELKPWLERIEQIRKQADEVYVITNNHYRGQAVVNAFEIQHALGARSALAIPEHLIAIYPRLIALSG